MRVPRAGGAVRPVWDETEVTDVAISPDRSRVAFVRHGDLFVRPLEGGTEVEMTHDIAGIGGPAWSPDGSRVAFSFAPVKRVEEAARYAGTKVAFTRFDRGVSRLGAVKVTGGAVTQFPASGSGEDSPRWLDSTRIVVQRMSEDLKTREIVVADADTGSETVIHRDVDPKFWSLTYLNAEPVPSPDGRWVAFVSDRDGWDHLYVVPSRGGEPIQVTRGRFEVTRFTWSPDSTRIAFDRNEQESPGTRHVAVATATGSWARVSIETLTSGRGTNTDAHWSHDGRKLVFEHTDSRNAADLYAIDAAPGAAARRLTDSMPKAIDRAQLVEPQFVRYAGPAGAQVPAYCSCRRNWTARGNIRLSSGFTATASIRTTTAGTFTAITASITAFISICCSRATSCSRSITGAASATAAIGGRATTGISAARTTRTSPPASRT